MTTSSGSQIPPPPRPNFKQSLYISREEEEYLAKSAAKPGMVVLPSGLQVLHIMVLTEAYYFVHSYLFNRQITNRTTVPHNLFGS